MHRKSQRTGYLIAVLGCFSVLFMRMASEDYLGQQARLMPFVLAVMASAWWGGLGPGILATFLGFLLGIYYIVPPADSFEIVTIEDGVNAILFVLIGLAISYLCAQLHQARRKEVEQTFRSLADSIPQLVWMAEPDGRRTWFNQRWYDFSGATYAEVQGSGWQNFCDPRELPRVLKSWQAALANGKTWEETYQLRRKDGQFRWHLARAVPVRDTSGMITRWFGTSTDIHDRIEIEQSLKDADARKDQFLATLAHELRNPLSPISNAIQLWPRVAHDPAEMEHLRTVMSRQVKQMIRLIDDLMDLSRITRGKISLHCETVDLCSLIAQASEVVQPLIEIAQHKLKIETPEEPIFVHGDLTRLTQVFANILNNAAKYTSPRGIIKVHAETQGNQAIIKFCDNGAGIPANQLTSIFEAFRQVDRTLDSSQGGLGIGLTLAKQLVEMHRGTIVAHSDGPDCGSEFVITLPVVAKPRCHSSITDSASVPCLCVRYNILVVDDLRESADTLAKLLCAIGQNATPLYDGASAIDWILTHHQDVVLLDIAMPGLDGYAIARRLREHTELRDTMLIALTGFGQPRDRKLALAAGFNEHLIKPVSLEKLEQVLGKLTQNKNSKTAVSCV